MALASKPPLEEELVDAGIRLAQNGARLREGEVGGRWQQGQLLVSGLAN
jgi:hypothetical protein